MFRGTLSSLSEEMAGENCYLIFRVTKQKYDGKRKGHISPSLSTTCSILLHYIMSNRICIYDLKTQTACGTHGSLVDSMGPVKNIVTRLRTGRSVFDSQQGRTFFSWPPRPDRPSDSPCLLYIGHSMLFPCS